MQEHEQILVLWITLNKLLKGPSTDVVSEVFMHEVGYLFGRLPLLC
jgi:hypothetical protein